MLARWGPQNGWPAQSRFEVIVGAYLPQNTAWTNVEKVIASLRRERLLSVEGIREVSIKKLENLVRSSGYFRQKARKLKIFIKYLDKNYGGSLDRLFAQPPHKPRPEPLSLNSRGPQTTEFPFLFGGQHT